MLDAIRIVRCSRSLCNYWNFRWIFSQFILSIKHHDLIRCFSKTSQCFIMKRSRKRIFEESKFAMFCIRSNISSYVFNDAVIEPRCDRISNILLSIDADNIKINDWCHDICFLVKCESHEQIKWTHFIIVWNVTSSILCPHDWMRNEIRKTTFISRTQNSWSSIN